MRLILDLTDDELTVLRYLVNTAASPYARDPFKNIYELGAERPEDPEAALATLAKRLAAFTADERCPTHAPICLDGGM